MKQYIDPQNQSSVSIMIYRCKDEPFAFLSGRLKYNILEDKISIQSEWSFINKSSNNEVYDQSKSQSNTSDTLVRRGVIALTYFKIHFLPQKFQTDITLHCIHF